MHISNSPVLLTVLILYFSFGSTLTCGNCGFRSNGSDDYGNCLCIDGFYGKHCQYSCQCSVLNSLGSQCAPLGQCKCIPNYYGVTCDKECLCYLPGSNGCDTMGRCICKAAHYSHDCSKACNCNVQNSVSNVCDNLGRCQCFPDSYGPKCQFVCNCTNCDANGNCYECSEGYYGNDCNYTCNCGLNAQGKMCDNQGYCRCRLGYFGKKCDKACNCNTNTNGACDSYGKCICTDGYYGDQCLNSTSICGKNVLTFSNPNSFHPAPWTAKIMVSGKMICTGAILSEKHILTIGECIKNRSMEQLYILIGDYNSYLWDVEERIYAIRHIVFHNQSISLLNGTTIATLAIITIGNSSSNIIQRFASRLIPYDFTRMFESSYAKPICIPDRNYRPSIYTNLIAGWGNTRNIVKLPRIGVSQVIKIADEVCPLTFGIEDPTYVLCMQSLNFTCQNEIGNLLYTATKPIVLIGLRIGGEEKCYVNSVNYYINLMKYTTWIRHIIMT